MPDLDLGNTRVNQENAEVVQARILQDLNTAQRSAVTARQGNICVLAGAGTGKTRFLINRIAWLIYKYDVEPHSILAMTFTNKAANEMKQRTRELIPQEIDELWIGTFHSIFLRMLRIHFDAANLQRRFQVIDASDQLAIIKRLLKETEAQLDSPKQIQNFINARKETGQRSRNIVRFGNPQMVDFYDQYERYCEQHAVIDFAEILLRSWELFSENPGILRHYQARFQHVLIDEFQDTNSLQYALLSQLKNAQNYATVVGDDDQSIYSWRGARPENIQQFMSDFKPVELVKLEQNYRSSSHILHAANALIDSNTQRVGKKLWTEQEAGELISVIATPSEQEEAQYVTNTVADWVSRSRENRYSDAAVLYRTNAQSNPLEHVFNFEQIPYKLKGATAFYSRAEIKNALAYMHMVLDPRNDSALQRIVNVPRRGIGRAAEIKLRQLAGCRGCSLWEAARLSSDKNMQRFVDVIEMISAKCHGQSLTSIAKICIEDTNLVAFHGADRGVAGETRVENLQELVSACQRFNPEDMLLSSTVTPIQREHKALEVFLDSVALNFGEQIEEAEKDAVTLMTLHAAKGLEFPLVFIVGLEEGYAPLISANTEEQGIEEERRLIYVGMTRAMQQLHMVNAQSRVIFGSSERRRRSRFISELPKNDLKKTTYSSFAEPLSSVAEDIPTRFRVGQEVLHDQIGRGTIVTATPQQVAISFNGESPRWFISESRMLHEVS